MENKKASIKRDKSNTYLVLETSNKPLQIILTDDNPNSIMTAFNGLILELKKGLFQFVLEDTKEDLYTHICKEYIKQLNAELTEVFNELEDYELLEE